MIRPAFLATAIVCGFISAPALAQSTDEFFEAFSGEWFVFDPRHGTEDATCKITLGTDGEGTTKPANASNCAAPLSQIQRWTIESGQLDLQSEDGATLVLMGGNQRRITGAFDETGQGLVMERKSGSAEAAALAEALREHGCFFLGYSSDCAPAKELRKPALSEETGQLQSIETRVNLNVRRQPSGSASVLGTVAENTCVRVDDCLVASDSVWCRARFGNESGWLAKSALRQDEWGVLTYVNSCSNDRDAPE